MSSIALTVAGTIIGSVTLNPIITASVAGPGIIIQGYLIKSDIDKKIDKCRFAYTSFQKILTNLRGFLRGMNYDKKELLHDIKTIDDIVIDSCPGIDHFYKKYHKKIFPMIATQKFSHDCFYFITNYFHDFIPILIVKI